MRSVAPPITVTSWPSAACASASRSTNCSTPENPSERIACRMRSAVRQALGRPLRRSQRVDECRGTARATSRPGVLLGRRAGSRAPRVRASADASIASRVAHRSPASRSTRYPFSPSTRRSGAKPTRRRHDGQAARERLEHHERIRLVGARQHEHVGGPEERDRVGLRAREDHAVGDAVGARPAPGPVRIISAVPPTTRSVHVGCARAAPSIASGRPLRSNSWPTNTATGCVAVDAELAPRAAARSSAVGGPEPLEVDAVRDDVDRRAHATVRRHEQVGLGRREGDDRPVRAAAVADAVAHAP